MSDILKYGCAYGEKKYGPWGAANETKMVIVITGFSGKDKVIPDGRVCSYCNRFDTELDHVHQDEPLAWGAKPLPSFLNKGSVCHYCARAKEAKFAHLPGGPKQFKITLGEDKGVNAAFFGLRHEATLIMIKLGKARDFRGMNWDAAESKVTSYKKREVQTQRAPNRIVLLRNYGKEFKGTPAENGHEEIEVEGEEAVRIPGAMEWAESNVVTQGLKQDGPAEPHPRPPGLWEGKGPERARRSFQTPQ